MYVYFSVYFGTSGHLRVHAQQLARPMARFRGESKTFGYNHQLVTTLNWYQPSTGF
jgi:hypothetical protein